ncbi:MAG: rubredoxin [Candidatus Thermoplasmatota archaeon]|nr:rubredoxin [Candidatus Thermoplasmatota archaeon]
MVCQMSKETILATMIHHHNIIMGLLNDFDHCLKYDTQLLMDAYDVLKWEFDKHLFIEEKIVFMAQELHDLPDVYEIIPRLVSDHEKFEKILLKMRNDIKKNNTTCNFLEFKELIYKHKDFEEKSLYPLLDEKLNNEKKTRIIKRINEISLDGNKTKNIKIECAECGKKIGFLTAFTNPVFGRRWHFCSSCFDKLEEERKENNLIKGRELWRCMVCGYIYNPEKGDSDHGIQQGVSFEDLPDDWVCPVCGVGKNKFKKV